MSKTQHTIGPWFLDQYGHIYSQGEPKPNDDGGTTSTSIHICTPQTTHADRILIAAAPDLLNSLKRIALAAESMAVGEHELREWIAREASQAIAKATGSNSHE